MPERVALDALVLRRDLYPRQDLSEGNISRIKQIRDAGKKMDPIVACRNTNIILDGAHRVTEARRRGDPDIEVEYRDYTTDADRFDAAVRLNTNHGLSLTPHDRLRCIEIGQTLGVREMDLADALAVSTTYLRSIKPRFATVTEATEEGGILRRKVPLKGSVRHLSGADITREQEREILGGAPGTPYLMAVRQLIRAFDLDLLPPLEQHPALWEDLAVLGGRITSLTQ